VLTLPASVSLVRLRVARREVCARSNALAHAATIGSFGRQLSAEMRLGHLPSFRSRLDEVAVNVSLRATSCFAAAACSHVGSRATPPTGETTHADVGVLVRRRTANDGKSSRGASRKRRADWVSVKRRVVSRRRSGRYGWSGGVAKDADPFVRGCRNHPDRRGLRRRCESKRRFFCLRSSASRRATARPVRSAQREGGPACRSRLAKREGSRRTSAAEVLRYTELKWPKAFALHKNRPDFRHET